MPNYCDYCFVAGPKKGQKCNRFLRKNNEIRCYQHKIKTPIEKNEVAPPIEVQKELNTIIPKGKPIKIRKQIETPTTSTSESDSYEIEPAPRGKPIKIRKQKVAINLPKNLEKNSVIQLECSESSSCDFSISSDTDSSSGADFTISSDSD